MDREFLLRFSLLQPQTSPYKDEDINKKFNPPKKTFKPITVPDHTTYATLQTMIEFH